MSSVYTAFPLIENGLEQPLLLPTEDEHSEIHNIALVDHDECNVNNNNLNSTSTVACWGQRVLSTRQFFNGFWLGFVIQTMSLGSTAIIAIYYGVSETEFSFSWMSGTYELFFFVFFLLSQSWWLLFPVICIAIESGLTGSQGQRTLERYFKTFHPSEINPKSQQSQREEFLGGVRFHVGIVFGCFIVWSMIDLYYGASLGIFANLAASFFACLGLCYCMIAIYDRYIIDEEQQQQTQQSLHEEV